MVGTLETDVLIVGSGPAGSTAAAFLSTYGIRNIQITKYGWLSSTPRAHITNQRTMEILRDLGVEEKAKQFASRQNFMANNVFCHSLSGEEFGRVLSWGNHPLRKADYELASPTEICDLPQTYLEPILLEVAGARGSTIRFNTEFLDLEEDENGVTATVKDRTTGEDYAIRCKYLIGADGGRSRVAERIGLPMEGQMGLSGSMNILFDADLTQYVQHRPSVLYWILQPGAEIGGIGAGVIRMVRPWTEWLAIWGYDLAEGELKITPEKAEAIVRQLIGDDEVPVKIRSTSTWTVNNQYATRYSTKRVFCAGDAVHRHPPLNGLGSNTSIQDSYNLAWKLSYVLKGKATDALLETYCAERQPVGKQIVRRANESIKDYPPIFEAIGIGSSSDPETVLRNMEARKAPTPEGKKRRRLLHEAIRRKNYEFNAHGVELNQRYQSSAIVPDGTPEPEYTRDQELYYHATTWPGARLPHVWLEKNGHRISSLDLCGKGRFVVLTGIGGEGWREAASAVSDKFDIDIDVVSIGPAGCDAVDIYGDWYLQSEIAEDGCILVRPDMHIAWRARTYDAATGQTLAGVFEDILGKHISA
ncbi:FAD-dependent oxidoreductase [Agrobacterium sp. NPDC058088]|uniref:FAD-dependent oxidoreductase n=1 Tax=Agrobacterium sp. NPDC058088 TaxID=3346335 RepID=UPI0036DE336E